MLLSNGGVGLEISKLDEELAAISTLPHENGNIIGWRPGSDFQGRSAGGLKAPDINGDVVIKVLADVGSVGNPGKRAGQVTRHRAHAAFARVLAVNFVNVARIKALDQKRCDGQDVVLISSPSPSERRGRGMARSGGSEKENGSEKGNS